MLPDMLLETLYLDQIGDYLPLILYLGLKAMKWIYLIYKDSIEWASLVMMISPFLHYRHTQ